jgi:predicted Co/Zn/Cd cation transporter (cation efflux family)
MSPSRLAEPGSCARTLKPTVRVPLPLASVVNEIHDALLVALHEQSIRVDTVKESVPPDAGKLKLVRLTSYVQGSGAAAFCETVKVWPAIVSVPLRAVVPLSVAL